MVYSGRVLEHCTLQTSITLTVIFFPLNKKYNVFPRSMLLLKGRPHIEQKQILNKSIFFPFFFSPSTLQAKWAFFFFLRKWIERTLTHQHFSRPATKQPLPSFCAPINATVGCLPRQMTHYFSCCNVTFL